MTGRELFKKYYLKESLNNSLGFIQDIYNNFPDLTSIFVLADYLEEHNVPAFEIFRTFQRFLTTKNCKELENINRNKILQIYSMVMQSFPSVKQSNFDDNLFGDHDSYYYDSRFGIESHTQAKVDNTVWTCLITYYDLANKSPNGTFTCRGVTNSGTHGSPRYITEKSKPPLEILVIALTNFVCNAVLRFKSWCKLQNNWSNPIVAGWNGTSWESVKSVNNAPTKINLCITYGCTGNDYFTTYNPKLLLVYVRITKNWLANARRGRNGLTQEMLRVIRNNHQFWQHEWLVLHLNLIADIRILERLAALMDLPDDWTKFPSFNEVIELNGL